MPPWHSDVFGIVSIHLALLSHSPPTICSTVIVDSWLPRAKLWCFSAKSDRCDSRSRRSDGSRCCSRASMNFNTFARWFFSVCRDRTALRRNSIRSLASRDPIAENHEKSMVFIEFLDDATRSSQTKNMPPSKCIDKSAANFVAPEHAWATNGDGARFVTRTPNQPYYLFLFFFLFLNIYILILISIFEYQY